MARQSTSPVSFPTTQRPESGVLMSSARAGKVVTVAQFPLLAGDSASGQVMLDFRLKDMPKPLLNAALFNVQAWVVPRTAFPQFGSFQEVMHARTGEVIKTLGQADRTPPPFFTTIDGAALTTAAGSDMFRTLGLHVAAGAEVNSDIIDAFNVVYNFRLAAYSQRLNRRPYATEDIAEATRFPPAFWPAAAMRGIVPDYERALVVGSLDLDVSAGLVELPFQRFGVSGTDYVGNAAVSSNATNFAIFTAVGGTDNNGISIEVPVSGPFYGDLTGQTITTTLADLDKARATQAFAKLRATYAGNDTTGFNNDDAIVALLMQGLDVAPELFNRPILLDAKTVPVGFQERFSSDATALDASLTRGGSAVRLSLNIPKLPTGGHVIVTVELVPERVNERMSDEYLYATSVGDLPDALRDTLRVEPVDIVLNRRIDAKHVTPNGAYGFEPMNGKWKREFTRLGGEFYQATPGAGWTETRAQIWQTELVNPTFGTSHYLCPEDFPHDVFADTTGPAFEFVCRHMVAIQGITQFGDVLVENNDEFAAVQDQIGV